MERYLLFDSGCSLCNALARDIERESKGWLTARSLRDPEIQAQLDRARPGWRWEPMLMEVQEDKIRTFVGMKLRWKLLSGLGPLRTWNVVQALSGANGVSTEMASGRRRILKSSAALLGGLALGLPWQSFGNQQAHANATANSINLQQLTTEQLRQLTQAPIVQAVNKTFGVLDWNEAYSYKRAANQEGYVILSLPHGTLIGVKATFLAVDTATSTNVVGQASFLGDHSLEIMWFTPDGQHFVTTTQNLHTGKVAATAPTITQFSYQCFIGCLGFAVSQYCANACLQCGLGGYLSCGVCLACAGVSGAYCAYLCR